MRHDALIPPALNRLRGQATQRGLAWHAMHRLVAASLLILCAACSSSTAVTPKATDPSSLRQLSQGMIEGFANAQGGHTWLGIPYAAPPVGPLRWRPPQPASSWDGTRTALSAGGACVQFGWPIGGIGKNGSHQGQEDCLYLNIHAPHLDQAELANAHVPVMVWIHGGANTIGQAVDYDGSQLAQSQNVIVVTINYRLGPFGWFILPTGGRPDQSERSALDASGNWGTLDTIAALQWVHDNIHGFGGDPGNVTVFGQSAGATNTLALLVSPLSEGLFSRVIIQSLGFGLAPMERMSHDVDDPQPGLEYSSAEILLKLLQSQGRAADRAQAKALVANLNGTEIADFLRSIDPWTLYTTYHPSTLATSKFPTVFQDGAVIRQGALSELLADPHRHLNVPAIVGTNRDEAKMFMAFDPTLVFTVAGLPVWIKDNAVYDRQSNYRALLWKANGVDQLAAALTASGTPTYAYRWDWDDEGRHYGIIDATRLVGASHGLEIPFVFGNFTVGSVSSLLFNHDNESARLQLSAAMMTYWGNFAHSGDPNQGTQVPTPAWPVWQSTEDTPALMVFDTQAQGGIRASNERSSKEKVLALMEAQEPNDASACRMFISTFRDRFNEWADRVWPTFKNGLCRAQISATRPIPP